MADGKSILIDVSRCTGCRGCQVACKQWNNLEATETVQSGTYQNPPDMDGNTYKVVRFEEGRDEKGKPYWHFFTDMCRHCVDAPCFFSAEEGTALHDEETGAVVFLDNLSIDNLDAVHGACPYSIPKGNEKTGKVVKCTMCLDRQKEGKIPACVQSCPTGCMVYGDRDEILALAEKRVEELKKEFPKAHALNPEEVRVIYILTDDDQKYGNITY